MPQENTRQKQVEGRDFRFAFADSYPATIGLMSSFNDLYSRLLKEGMIDISPEGLIRRMRPNVVFAGEGVESYEDDTWTEIQLENGVCVYVIKMCLRCPIPQIDQTTAQKGREPNKTLHTHRAVLDDADKRSVAFCQKAVITPGDVYPGLKVVSIKSKRPKPTFITK